MDADIKPAFAEATKALFKALAYALITLAAQAAMLFWLVPLATANAVVLSWQQSVGIALLYAAWKIWRPRCKD